MPIQHTVGSWISASCGKSTGTMNQKQEKCFCGAPSGQIMCVYIMHQLTRYKEYVYIVICISHDLKRFLSIPSVG